MRSATDNAAASAPDDVARSAKDPVCGMTVDPRTAVSFTHDGRKYYFCCDGCRDKFAANPRVYLEVVDASAKRGDAAHQPQAGRHGELPGEGDGAHTSDRAGPPATAWTCPMHPEIRRDAPGACPICGMALEPLEPTAEEGENEELADMTRRFWIGVALTVPLLLAMLGEFVPAIDPMRVFGHTTVAWAQLALATPGRALVRRAVFRSRLAVDRQSQREHVHADRARHWRCVALLRGRDARARRAAAVVPRRTARRRCTSRPRP